MTNLAQGSVIGGKYRLEEAIGSGGMACVWRATHTTLESPVAVKFLETYGSNRDQMARRFLREARLAANLRHRNVVHILDHGMMEDGQPFMVMELLAGVTLGDRLEGDHPPGDLEMLTLMEQVLSGLASVHDAGIVHRDVKPDNIFIVRDADGEYPKLLDFGISRDEDPNATGSTRMTKTGAVVGTPLYMSPEQARGVRDLDRRSDLWSVGMMLYEGLTGICPFESENMGEVLIKVATEPCPPLSEYRPDLPPTVGDLVMRALEKGRDARWQDARTMREAVRGAADEVAKAAGTTPPVRRYPSQVRQSAARVADTALAPVPPRVAKSRTPWIVLGGFGAMLTVAVIAFAALGGEIRFQSAAAESDLASDAPSGRATRRARRPRPPRDESDVTVAADPGETVPAETTTDDTASVAGGLEVEADPPLEAPAQPEVAVETGADEPAAPAETHAETVRPRPPRPNAERSGSPPHARDPQPAGGFLRDLDY